MRDQLDIVAAYRALLATPDPLDLRTDLGIGRGRHYICAGDQLRQDLLKRDLERAFVRWRMFDHGEEARIVSVRRIQLVRRRA